MHQLNGPAAAHMHKPGRDRLKETVRTQMTIGTARPKLVFQSIRLSVSYTAMISVDSGSAGSSAHRVDYWKLCFELERLSLHPLRKAWNLSTVSD